MNFEAANFGSPGPSRQRGDDSMIPLINIVFMMLVFFMVAGEVAEPERTDFDAPDSRSENRLHAAQHSLLLAADGSIWLNGEPLVSRSANVLQRQGVDAGHRLVIKAHAGLAARRLDPLLTTLREVGLKELELAVETGVAP